MLEQQMPVSQSLSRPCEFGLHDTRALLESDPVAGQQGCPSTVAIITMTVYNMIPDQLIKAPKRDTHKQPSMR